MKVCTITMRLASLVTVQSRYRECDLQWVNLADIARPALKGTDLRLSNQARVLNVMVDVG